MKRHKEILYPNFLKLAQFVDDFYWKHIFYDFAYDICPNGSYIDKNVLYSTCAQKENRFAFDLTTRPVNEETTRELISLLKTKLNLMSGIESLLRRENLNNELRKRCECWKDIKKKSIRDVLIEDYIIRIMKDNHLTIQQGQRMLKHVNIQLYFKLLSSQDIIYSPEQYRIKDIQNFDFKAIL